jgi:C-terminal processing protease CtpA/Prc
MHIPAGYGQHRQIRLNRDGQLGLNIVTEDMYPRIVGILPDSVAAANGGFQQDDYILQVGLVTRCWLWS